MTQSDKFKHEVPVYLQALDKGCKDSSIEDWHELFDSIELWHAEQHKERNDSETHQ